MTKKEYKSFKVEISDHVANLILSRPDQLNTMSRDFWVELGEVTEEINMNSEVRVLIMSSTGKHFCAGMDLTAFSNGVDNIPENKKPRKGRNVGHLNLSLNDETDEYQLLQAKKLITLSENI